MPCSQSTFALHRDLITSLAVLVIALFKSLTLDLIQRRVLEETRLREAKRLETLSSVLDSLLLGLSRRYLTASSQADSTQDASDIRQKPVSLWI
jgi:hypothetical protein